MKSNSIIILLLLFQIKSLASSHSREQDDVKFVGQTLRKYCKACHGLGKLRFIHSENDNELWDYILNNRAPNSGDYWYRSIQEVLDWPSDDAPPFNQMMLPPNQDWMPKGIKRLQLARDEPGNISTRKRVLSILRNGPH